MSGDQRCDNCFYSKAVIDTGLVSSGFVKAEHFLDNPMYRSMCRRFPPMNNGHDQPRVENDGWCGEWKERI